MVKRCVIVGSGNSLTEAFEKKVSKLLQNEVVFTINEEFRFFDSTLTTLVDWTFYKCRYNLLKSHPMIVGRWDSHIGAKDRVTKEYYCERLSQLILLPSCSKYVGQDSWKKGFFTGVLAGLFTLTFTIALGFEEIMLCGFDGKSINGKTHHYEGQFGFGHFIDDEGKPRTGMGKKNGVYNTGVFNKDRKRFNKDFWDVYKPELERIKIYNVSPESTIDTFPKISYDEFISILKKNPSNINQDLIRKEIKEYITSHAKFDKNNFCCIN